MKPIDAHDFYRSVTCPNGLTYKTPAPVVDMLIAQTKEIQQLHAQIKALTEELESLDNCGMHPLC